MARRRRGALAGTLRDERAAVGDEGIGGAGSWLGRSAAGRKRPSIHLRPPTRPLDTALGVVIAVYTPIGKPLELSN